MKKQDKKFDLIRSRGAVELMSDYRIKECRSRISFSVFQEIFSFFNLELEEDILWDYWRLLAGTIVNYVPYPPKELLFKDFCEIIVLILKSIVDFRKHNFLLKVENINQINRNHSLSYKICLELIDIVKEYKNDVT